MNPKRGTHPKGIPERQGQAAPRDLKCEYRSSPLGIDVRVPRLSWCVADGRRGAKQSAYRILVATTPQCLGEEHCDVWDSGVVSSARNNHVEYAGPALQNRRRYWWSVQSWDREGRASGYAVPAWWEMGLLEASDWQARWISSTGAPGSTDEDSMRGQCRPLRMRREFVLSKDVARARVYASGLGCYTLRLNGKPMGNDLFTPGWTVYEKRIQYQTYDVTALLSRGGNALGATLGNGWWAGGLSLGRGKIERTSVGNLRLLVQLEVEFIDGSTLRVVTDRSWRTRPAPILESSFYQGETFDARLEAPGWDRPGFDDHGWGPAVVLEDALDGMVAQQTEPIRVTQELPVRSATSLCDGARVLDFGQNHAGRARIKVSGARGTRIQMRFAETLNRDGSLDRRNLVGAQSTDTYTLRGADAECWEPQFSYRGYRYAELAGYPGELPDDGVVSQVLHSDVSPAGRFECSNTLLNDIQRNIVWALRSNLMSVPTDCPQRDERLGWLGDGHVIAPTACWNMGLATFYPKWLRDIRDSQHESGYVCDVAPAAVLRGPAAPGWGDAIVGIPWTLYRFYGDTRVIQENFDAMRLWVEYMRAHATHYLYRCPHELKEDGYGDWVAPVESPKQPIAAAFFYYSTRLLATMAKVIGRANDAERYQALADEIRVAFNTAYLDQKTNSYQGGTQTANIIPLTFGLAPEDRRSAILENVVRDIEARGTHLSTGFLGTAYVLPLLSDNGYHELAYRLATQRTFPSWGYMVDCGATTMCELWNPDTGDPRMNSWNHFALGSVGQWFFEALGGINLVPSGPVPGAELSRGVLVRPRPVNDLEWAQAEYEATEGTLRSAWRREEDGYRFDVTIPANTSARVCVPTFGWVDAVVREGATVLWACTEQVGSSEGLQPRGVDAAGFALVEVEAGEYSFMVTGGIQKQM